MPADLTLASFSDRELLHMLADAADSEGWVSSEHLMSVLGLTRNGKSDADYAKHVRQCVGVRMGWMRRLSQTVEKHPTEVGTWRLSVTGREVVKASLPISARRSLENLGDFTALSALELLGRRYVRSDVNAANLMRREWAYGTHRTRRAS